MGFTIEIPIKPHLKYFLANWYSIEPYTLSRKHTFGKFLYKTLKRPLAKNEYKPIPNYGAFLTVSLTEHQALQNYIDYDKRVAREINNYIDNHFRFIFHCYCDMFLHFNKGSLIKDAIEAFRQNYLLDTSISYDTLKKDYYRYRNSTNENMPKKGNKIFLNLSPVF